MQYSLAAFYEPRGVMRILQFIFAIVAFVTTANFTTNIHSKCETGEESYLISYPFSFEYKLCNQKYDLSADFSSDSQFFVATGVLSMMYCIFIIAVYAIIDELYRNKSEFPLADFFISSMLAIFWLAGSSAWSNSTTILKTMTEREKLTQICSSKSVSCKIMTESFSNLNISLLIGFLNFFLWASGLWFLYKETIWFKGRQNNNMQNPSAGSSSTDQPNV